ncbi:hypothetical protein CEXT_438651 [Caerostris extrusa]|uniref:Uncharacterized protein n=1 Tax=Caerostris extrusa TaxID=172846 RepID=A0AAV4X489_CAEEX|nr:hypothetical protein CEXT_438651 [Caerostris extrusa]
MFVKKQLWKGVFCQGCLLQTKRLVSRGVCLCFTEDVTLAARDSVRNCWGCLMNYKASPACPVIIRQDGAVIYSCGVGRGRKRNDLESTAEIVYILKILNFHLDFNG